MHRLARRLTLGHALLIAGLVIATFIVVTYAVVVRQADNIVMGCTDANAKWLATARKDIRDAAGEGVLAMDADATALERDQHMTRSTAALDATAQILRRVSIPAAQIDYDAHGTPLFRDPSPAARLAYCHARYPRPWPLG